MREQQQHTTINVTKDTHRKLVLLSKIYELSISDLLEKYIIMDPRIKEIEKILGLKK